MIASKRIGVWVGENGEPVVPDPSNPYRYVLNNPLNYTDPNGLSAVAQQLDLKDYAEKVLKSFPNLDVGVGGNCKIVSKEMDPKTICFIDCIRKSFTVDYPGPDAAHTAGSGHPDFDLYWQNFKKKGMSDWDAIVEFYERHSGIQRKDNKIETQFKVIEKSVGAPDAWKYANFEKGVQKIAIYGKVNTDKDQKPILGKDGRMQITEIKHAAIQVLNKNVWRSKLGAWGYLIEHNDVRDLEDGRYGIVVGVLQRELLER